MNRGKMRLEVRRAIDELTAEFWTDAEINDWLNEGAKTLVAIAQPLQMMTQFNTIANQQEYVLNPDIDEIFSVNFNDGSNLYQLEPCDAKSVQWGTPSTSTYPTHFYLRFQSLATGGHAQSGIILGPVSDDNAEPQMTLGLHPSPQVTGKAVTISYYARHVLMTNDLQVPQIPVEFHRGIVYYAVAQAKVKDEAYAESDKFMEKFSNYAEKLRDKVISGGQEMRFPKVTDRDTVLSPPGDIIIRLGTAS